LLLGCFSTAKETAAIGPNVRRYVALAQSRGGARFCTRGAMLDYAVITIFSRWQKP